MSLKKNVIANYLGQGWTALMRIAFVPLYIKYLGMESYGLIGIFAVLQSWLSLLDMGMTPTLGREMSRYSGGAHTAESILDLLRSLEILCTGIAALIVLGVWGASGWLASSWLQAEKLPVTMVAQVFIVMGVVAALRFVEGLYRSAIVGLQRQVLLNSIDAVMSTLRGAGAVAILKYFSPSIKMFFLWQGILTFVTVVIYVFVVYVSLPRVNRKPRFSKSALDKIWHFAAGLMATTLVTLLLTQVDKVLLSRLLNLKEFGIYTLAGLVAGVLSILSGPIAQASYPRMTELLAREKQDEVKTLYHRSAQLITVLVGSASVMMILFSEQIIALWTGSHDIAERVSPILTLLSIGNLLNSVMIIPYMLQLAHGWSSFAAKVNAVAVAILVPAILWATPRYGAIGAAWVWVILNCGYVFISIHFMHMRLIPGEKLRWYSYDLGLPIFACLLVAAIFRYFQPVGMARFEELTWLILCGLFAFAAAMFFASELRADLKKQYELLLRKIG